MRQKNSSGSGQRNLSAWLALVTTCQEKGTYGTFFSWVIWILSAQTLQSPAQAAKVNSCLERSERKTNSREKLCVCRRRVGVGNGQGGGTGQGMAEPRWLFWNPLGSTHCFVKRQRNCTIQSCGRGELLVLSLTCQVGETIVSIN